ncbi:MAG: ABC transporter permease [Bacteroidales bacterium]|nr:ABC transporter permease [Bacteroidales bacterium]
MARLFKKGKTAFASSVLNVLGLTAAFAALYIILVQVHHDLTYNKALKDSDRIYVLTQREINQSGYSSYMCRPMGEYVLNASPDIEAGGCGKIMGNPIAVRVSDDQSPVAITVAAMNQGARDVFGFELVAGNWEDLTGNGYALSESAAQRLGVQVGDVIKYHDGSAWQDMSIVAIYKEMPKHSDLSSFEMLANMGDFSIDDWSEFSFFYFLKLREGADPSAITEVAKPVCKQFFSIMQGVDATDDDVKFGLYPVRLTDMYFDSNSYYAPGKAGNKTTTMTLLIIAIFVVVIAFINYINFFFAMVPLRLKSINTRKILGSSRFQLVMSSVGESVLMVVIALGLAVAVVTLFKQSTLASLIDTSLDFSQNFGVVALTVGLGLFVSVAASLYPALFATSFNPAFALKGTFGATQKGKAFRIGLIGLQFTVSIVLIICAIFVHQQRQYMMNHDMGFNQECLLQSQVSTNLATNREAVESQLRADAAIKDIAWGDGPFVNDYRMSWGRKVRGEDAGWDVYPVSWNFLRFMGIDVVEGRDFSLSDEQSTGTYIFNETARDMYKITLEDQIGGHDGQIAEIAGFCKDFNFASLRQEIKPFAFYVYGKDPWHICNRLYIRTKTGVDVPALMERIRKTLNDLDPDLGDGMSYEVWPFSESIENQYKKEQNLSKLVNLFTVLAIVISLMGVFGLVMFETEHRRKEIGIRRVHGATVEQILAMFNSRFVKIVLVCFVIAVPVSIVIMRRYLEGFAYQVPLHVWVFVIALLAVLGVTIAVVTLRSLRAATVNPVKSLRSE